MHACISLRVGVAGVVSRLPALSIRSNSQYSDLQERKWLGKEEGGSVRLKDWEGGEHLWVAPVTR